MKANLIMRITGGNITMEISTDNDTREPTSLSNFPWLIPVVVAVAMVMFLIVSFALHHRRYLIKKRTLFQYYTVQNRRVAGPSLKTPELSPDCEEAKGMRENAAGGPGSERKASKGGSPLKLSDKLRRCYSLSPRHLKSKDASKSREDSPRDIEVVNEILQKEGRERRHRKKHRMEGDYLHPDHVSFLRISTCKSLAGPKRRAIVVTTVTGTLVKAVQYDAGSDDSLGVPDMEQWKGQDIDQWKGQDMEEFLPSGQQNLDDSPTSGKM